jgi:hypothetical protein
VRASCLFVLTYLTIQAASGSTISYTGTLASPDDVSTAIIVTLTDPGILTLQTWGFGGGTNAAATDIAAGGFDPFVGVFAGTGSTAAFIDGTSDILSNYSAHMGCPPAGLVTIGGEPLCGDVQMSFSLDAGTYTVLLTDGAYIPTAVFEDGGTLGDGFTDFTGGAFQTCDASGDTCVTDAANWALDISTPDSEAPEPAGWWACTLALILGVGASQRSRLQARIINSTNTYKRR